ncbi:MAG: Nif3-like dinuclear metal center hexameric protein [Candidatus Hydrogenedentota bacterium]
MTVRDICSILDEIAPPRLAYSWDKPGLHTGEPDSEVNCVLVTLTITMDTIKEAKRRQADMIVAHHPLIWKPLTSLRRDDPHTALCLALAEHRIACYAAHTNLDVVPEGVSYCLGKRLALEDMRPLLPVEHAGQVKLVTFVPESHLEALRTGVCNAGAGEIGDYTECSFSTPGRGTFRPGKASAPFSGRKGKLNEEPEVRFETVVSRARLGHVLHAMFEAHPYEEPAYDIVPLENDNPEVGLGKCGLLKNSMPLGAFAEEVRRRLRTDYVRVVGNLKEKVESVAVIGGSGGGELERVPSNIDVVVTGEPSAFENITQTIKGLPEPFQIGS